jgi:hypothetical protein
MSTALPYPVTARKLRPVHGVTDPKLYANVSETAAPPVARVPGPGLQLVPKESGAALKRAAVDEAAEESHRKRKVEQANSVLDRLEHREAAVALEIKRLSQLKAAIARRIERIEDVALTLMEDAGLAAVAGIRCTWTTGQTPETLVIDDQTKVPLEYMRQPPAPGKEPDKTAIKKAFKANAELAPAAWGCRLTSTTKLVRK